MEGSKVEFLFLSQEEMIEAGVLDMQKCVDTLERAFELMGEGDYLMGGPSGNHHGIQLLFPKEARGPRMPVQGPDRRFMAMISYLGGEFHVCGTKWYGSNVENPTKHGLPRSVLLVIINDPETGAPLAIMDGNLISAMRTGGAIGLGARYLARKGAETAGVVGAGVISKTCLMALKVGMPNLKTIKVYDIHRSKAEAFSDEMGRELSIDVFPVGTLKEAVIDSDAISTATSGTDTPFFETNWFKEGAFFGISAWTDVADDMWLNWRVVADNWGMHMDWREEMAGTDNQKSLIYPSLHDLIQTGKMDDNDIVELKDVVAGITPGRESDPQQVVFITGGLGIEDVSWGHTVYQQAVEKGLGTKLKLWDTPHWF